MARQLSGSSGAGRPTDWSAKDQLFPLAGAEAAHDRIAAHYAAAGASTSHTGQFFDGPHKFDRAMQTAAFGWLSDVM
ncbi:hypothetical protein AB0E63_38885 [Kribbella sp. NPDC026596]|uniref:hypothetical protein n=1 Tax=Kribbella sp. NPDC026596 TaxID=3155122 RepID=UPI0034071F19